MDVSRFVSGLSRMQRNVSDAMEQTVADASRAAYDSLVQTPTFENRSYSLRPAFSEAGDENGRAVFVDPTATGPGKTTPNTYARFLNYGTTRGIEARGFEVAAHTVGTDAVALAADRNLGNAIR